MRYITIADQRMYLSARSGARHADGTSEQCDDCGNDSASFVRTDSVTHFDVLRCPECDQVYVVRDGGGPT